MGVWIELARVVLVIALLCAAGALAVPPGRLPVPIRGLARLLGRERSEAKASPLRRLIAFLLAILAFVAAIWRV